VTTPVTERVVNFLTAKEEDAEYLMSSMADKINGFVSTYYTALRDGRGVEAQRIAMELASLGVALASETAACRLYQDAAVVARRNGPDGVVEWAHQGLMAATDSAMGVRGNDALGKVAEREGAVYTGIIRFVQTVCETPDTLVVAYHAVFDVKDTAEPGSPLFSAAGTACRHLAELITSTGRTPPRRYDQPRPVECAS
jgi:hypothetical protein